MQCVQSGFYKIVKSTFCLLLLPNSIGNRVIVVNTHLFSPPIMKNVRMMQIFSLIRKIEDLSYKYTEDIIISTNDNVDIDNSNTRVDNNTQVSSGAALGENPSNSSPNKKKKPSVILCGDLNADPTSGVYELIKNRMIQPSHHDWFPDFSLCAFTSPEKQLSSQGMTSSTHAGMISGTGSIGQMHIDHTISGSGIVGRTANGVSSVRWELSLCLGVIMFGKVYYYKSLTKLGHVAFSGDLLKLFLNLNYRFSSQVNLLSQRKRIYLSRV